MGKDLKKYEKRKSKNKRLQLPSELITEKEVIKTNKKTNFNNVIDNPNADHYHRAEEGHLDLTDEIMPNIGENSTASDTYETSSTKEKKLSNKKYYLQKIFKNKIKKLKQMGKNPSKRELKFKYHKVVYIKKIENIREKANINPLQLSYYVNNRENWDIYSNAEQHPGNEEDEESRQENEDGDGDFSDFVLDFPSEKSSDNSDCIHSDELENIQKFGNN